MRKFVLNYPRFLKSKTGLIYIRRYVNKQHNYAIYHHCYESGATITPMLTDEVDEFTKSYTPYKWDWRQFKCLLKWRVKRLVFEQRL